MMYKDKATGNPVIDTEAGQSILLRSGDHLSMDVLESIVDVPSPWFRKALEGENPEVILRSLEFSEDGINLGYTVNYDVMYDRLERCVSAEGLQRLLKWSTHVVHKQLDFLAPGEMTEGYFYLEVFVVTGDAVTEEYQIVFTPATLYGTTVIGPAVGEGAYGALQYDDFFVKRAESHRTYVGYRDWAC
ncbi:hypothetical protein IJI72_01185 [Candidatus Saccharibacteria bacterium]|nr:hypothetical protein [Candidatus Saccharibacteria bacterium]